MTNPHGLRPVGKVLPMMQEAVCRGLAAGKSRTDAALDAGYAVKSAAKMGSELSLRPDIIARVEELARLSTTDSVMGLVEAKERLSTIAREDNYTEKGSLNRGGSLEAIKQLSKMQGWEVRRATSPTTAPPLFIVFDKDTADILGRIAKGERREGESDEKVKEIGGD